MAQTPDELRAQIAHTREQLSQTLAELDLRVEQTKRSVPFYGMDRGRVLTVVGGASLAFLAVFVALYARQRGFGLEPRRGLRQLIRQKRRR
jgi:hypothetical protein